MNVRNLNYQVKFLASSDSISLYKEAICEFFLSLRYDKFEKKIEFGEVKTSPNEFNYDELFEMPIIITCSDIKINSDFANFATHIHKTWCTEALKNKYLQWLIPENAYINSPTYVTIGSLRPNEIAFGTLPLMKDYVQTYHFRQLELRSVVCSSILCNFNHLQKQITIFISNTHNTTCQFEGDMAYKIVFSYDSIIRLVANIDSNLDANELFIHLEYPPFLFVDASKELDLDLECEELSGHYRRISKAKEIEYHGKKFERIFEMGCSCNRTLWRSKTIGRNLVLKLVVEDRFQFRWNLEQMSLRCSKKTEICFTSVTMHSLTKENKVPLKFFPHHIYGRKVLFKADKFNCDYAWSVVHSRSDVILHQISCKNIETPTYVKKVLEVIKRCTRLNVSAFVKSLYCVSDMIDRGLVFNFLSVLKKKFLYFCKSVELNELPKGMSYVRRIIITPSRVICLQPYEHFDNRIIRKFGVEFMMRASVQDDDFSKLTYAVQYNSKKEDIMQNVVGDILMQGFTIGSRKYEPLAASTSQLREHGMWMYAADQEGNTASSIRSWMGDFSAIKNVAKYMARMGQCLSSTETGVQILINEEDEENWNDIKTLNGRYTFSDGIGIISTKLAEEIRQVMLQNLYAASDISLDENNLYKPVAFQIRYKGCKGMVVEYPSIEGRKLIIRPSMKKFECTTSNQLEIVKTSAPTKLFLNKHLITILEQMGVPKEAFMNLELNMILHLLDSLMSEKAAASLLSQYLSPVFPFSTLLKAGISLTSDPFFRSLLLAHFKSFAGKLKANMRIAVPEQYGRNMLGVLDETNSLKYGQVFVQYSKSLTDPKAGCEILEGPVLVTKNPSLHPGDVRKLKAVDCKKLHHIKDCIVFPAQGKRPHPDEMAGSDLDGDEMVVLWYKPLTFPGRSAKPMDYPVYEEVKKVENIQLSDMVKFFCEYIQNDNIGTFAHAHLVWADRLERGIFSKKCMDIAQRYPYVLDFAKHGTTEYLKKSEKPYHYPDFLEKGLRGNTYHSRKVLGSLYRISRVVDACSSKIHLTCEAASFDPDLEYPGWKKYESSAENHRKEYVSKVLEVLNRYALTSEAEAFSGFVELEAYKKWRKEKSNAVKVVKKYLKSIMGHYRNVFLSEVRKESDEEKLSREESLKRKYQRASAWYMVVYGKTSKRVLSFPWVLSDVLSEIKWKQTKSSNAANLDMPSFFQEMDSDIKDWYTSSNITFDNEKCLCSNLLQKITLEWISKSGLNIGNSDESAYCSQCFDRIFKFYLSKSGMYCCTHSSLKSCTCKENCSPTKLLVDFLKLFITSFGASLGTCDNASCDGFLPKNLQELALQTYSYIAITRNIFYLGIHHETKNFTKNAIPYNSFGSIFEEEGDPIKIPVNEILKSLINDHMDDIKAYLKKTSGVSDITVTPEPSSMCLIVNSIGKNWQRWNLEEILLDTNFIGNLKESLKITEIPVEA